MSYGVFAEFYDGLTRNVDYQVKADYICEIFKRFNHNPECVLDLACGTGTLTIELKKRGFDIYGVDASAEMLSQAQFKAAEEELDIFFLNQFRKLGRTFTPHHSKTLYINSETSRNNSNVDSFAPQVHPCILNPVYLTDIKRLHFNGLVKAWIHTDRCNH